VQEFLNLKGVRMAYISVLCPCCKGDNVVKRGKTGNGKQRYLCLTPHCVRKTFILDYTHQGHSPGIKEQIIDMAMNGSEVRDTARVLNISPGTVINEIKKKNPVLNGSIERCWAL
jgi:transposase-like protein